MALRVLDLISFIVRAKKTASYELFYIRFEDSKNACTLVYGMLVRTPVGGTYMERSNPLPELCSGNRNLNIVQVTGTLFRNRVPVPKCNDGPVQLLSEPLRANLNRVQVTGTTFRNSYL